MQVKIIATTQPLDFEPQYLIEYAGRVCTNTLSKFGQGSERFIRQRINEQHLGLLEHNSVTFLVEGISRVASHQLVRHRLGSYAQMSERFCDVRDTDAVLPASIAAHEDTFAEYEAAVTDAYTSYEHLIKSGIPREDARMVLPQGVETTILVTMNLRSYLHLFDMRIHEAAQWEIREMCIKMLDLLIFYAPAVFVPYHQEVARKYPDWFKETKDVRS